MAAVTFALASAVLFGATAVALAFSFQRSTDSEAGALVTGLVALGVTAVLAVSTNSWGGELWPFLVAGILAPGASQLFYVRAVREVGASRAAVVVGGAPLVSITIALTALGEPLEPALTAGALLIVLGGLALAGERDLPTHFRPIGLVLAFASVMFFATRDNVVRWLAQDTAVDPQVAASATLVSGCALMATYVVVARRRNAGHAILAAVRPFALPGLLIGVSTAALFEAFYRGRVSVVSPLVATEALFGVLLAAIIVGKSELIGRHVLAAAGLIVCGGVLIGAFR